MNRNGITSRRNRHWTRVASAPAWASPSTPSTLAPGEHRFVVYDARVVRCSCGATILATDPAVLRAAVEHCDVDVIAAHTAWCEELGLSEFGARAIPTASS